MKPETFNTFMIGFAVGYCVRHFFTPKAAPTWQYVVAGIMILIALAVYVRICYKDKPSSRKNK